MLTIAEQHKREGPNLWETNPDHRCHIRKVEPLLRLLVPYDAWVSGIRRDQSPSRANAKKVARSGVTASWKVQPLADWSEKDVWRYILETTFLTTRCTTSATVPSAASCTRPTRPDEEERQAAGAGSDKLECGIHVEQKDV